MLFCDGGGGDGWLWEWANIFEYCRDSLFSSKTTLDAMINTVKGGDGDILDVLLVGDVNGKVLVK